MRVMGDDGWKTPNSVPGALLLKTGAVVLTGARLILPVAVSVGTGGNQEAGEEVWCQSSGDRRLPLPEGPGESLRFMGSELRATVNKAFHGGRGGVPPKQGMGRTPCIGRARGPSRHLHTHPLPSSLSKPSILSCFPCKKAEVHESDWLKLQSEGWVLGLLGAS